MKIYSYDKETKEYIGSSEARKDPLELKKFKKTRYIIPSHSTIEVPPENTDPRKIIIWEDSKWVAVNKDTSDDPATEETFEDFKARILAKINEEFKEKVMNHYPQEVQFGVSLGIYSTTVIKDCADFVKSGILERNRVFLEVQEAITIEQINDAIPLWPEITPEAINFWLEPEEEIL